MSTNRRWARRFVTPLVALAVVAGIYALTRPPALSSSEAETMASRFKFTRLPLPELPGARYKSVNVRQVHPSLERISAWISTLGAAVALVDLDGDGLPNDLCYVDPRTDQIIVAPVPGTGDRYKAFDLNEALKLDEPLEKRPLRFYDPSTMAPMGCIIGDFNEDGQIDILVYYWGRTPVIFLQKKKTGQQNQAGLASADFVPFDLVPNPDQREEDGGRWFTNAVTQADLDGDGHIDLIVGNYFQDGARILDSGTEHAAEVQQMHATKAKAFNGGHKHLFLWKKPTSNEPVRFEEQHGVLSEAVDRGWALAVGAADLDGDGLPEIYFAFDFGPDRLLHNRSKPGKLEFAVLEGKRDLTTPTSCVLNNDSFKGMGCDFGDINGDGWLDIYVSNIATEFALQESHFLWQSTGEVQAMKAGIAPYEQKSEELGLSRSGWGWDCRLADFDNDGVLEAIQAVGFLKGQVNRWPELQALATVNSALLSDPRRWPRFQPGADLSGGDVDPFFVRGEDRRYYNIVDQLKTSVGDAEISGLGGPMVSRGIALADVDGDGRLDFALANQWGPSYFFHNQAPNAGEFLGLHLLLPVEGAKPWSDKVLAGHHRRDDAPGRPAIGAAASVHLPDGRTLVGQVDGGSGHSGKRSPDVHFGLGKLGKDAKVKVDLRWRAPDGTSREKTLDLAAGWYTIQLD